MTEFDYALLAAILKDIHDMEEQSEENECKRLKIDKTATTLFQKTDPMFNSKKFSKRLGYDYDIIAIEQE